MSCLKHISTIPLIIQYTIQPVYSVKSAVFAGTVCITSLDFLCVCVNYLWNLIIYWEKKKILVFFRLFFSRSYQNFMTMLLTWTHELLTFYPNKSREFFCPGLVFRLVHIWKMERKKTNIVDCTYVYHLNKREKRKFRGCVMLTFAENEDIFSAM